MSVFNIAVHRKIRSPFNNQQIFQITAVRCNNIESLKANTGAA